MLRLARRGLDLLPQLDHELIERARGAVILDTPNLGQDRLARDSVATLPMENGEHLELTRGELEGLFPSRAAEGAAIDAHPAKRNFFRHVGGHRTRRRPAEQRLHAGEQLAQ